MSDSAPPPSQRETLEILLGILREHDLDALTVRTGGATFELVLRPEASAHAAGFRAPPSEPEIPQAIPVAVASETAKKVTAPIIGVFYRAPAPGAETFVEVGDQVSVGQVLCILEAMKLMNDITSDYAGVVSRILPENGALVSLGEDMFWIEP